jgi:hypothetical protein
VLAASGASAWKVTVSPPPLVVPVPGTATPSETRVSETFPPPRVAPFTAPAFAFSWLSVVTLALATTFVAPLPGCTARG